MDSLLERTVGKEGIDREDGGTRGFWKLVRTDDEGTGFRVKPLDLLDADDALRMRC
jgi:hypothetical protein